MEDLITEITKASKEWYRLIEPEHHKDKDCHFYVLTKWSYGEPPKYVAHHKGYLAGDLWEEFGTYEDALECLRDFILKCIDEEKMSQSLLEDFNN